MGGLLSKKTGETPPVLQFDGNVQYTADLSSYEADCKLDQDLQSFDSILQTRTNHVINTIAVGVVQAHSFDALKEAIGWMLDMNQEVTKIILKSKEDIWMNQDLFGLVEEYLDNSLQTLNFCTHLEKCLKKASDSQLIINAALKQFEEEDRGDEKKYLRTLEELKNFKAAEHPFTEEFFQAFRTVYNQQVLMLKKLQLRKSKLDKKLKSRKAWRKFANIIFVATFAAILIGSVVAAAIAAPPVVAALAAATSVPVGSMGTWVNSLLKNYENALKGQNEVLASLYGGTFLAIQDLSSIRVLVNRLEIEMESLLQNADFSIREEGAVKFGIEEMKKKLGVFMRSIEDLDKQADKCSEDIKMARIVVLRSIISHPNNRRSF